jgi:hypothetical protein
MAVRFAAERVDDYVSAMVWGEMKTLDDALGFWPAFRKEAVRLGVRLLLVDYTQVEYALDYYGMIQLAEHAESVDFHQYCFKIAFVVRPRDLETFTRYQTPAINRGINYQPFTNRDEALTWLLSKA